MSTSDFFVSYTSYYFKKKRKVLWLNLLYKQIMATLQKFTETSWLEIKKRKLQKWYRKKIIKNKN